MDNIDVCTKLYYTRGKIFEISPMFKWLYSFLQLLALAPIYAQRHPAKLIGTVSIDKVSSIDQTEVTIQEYMYFIINNHFDSALFPKPESMSSVAKYFFDDLHGNREFVTIKPNRFDLVYEYGVKGFAVTKAYENFIAMDTSGFSIFNPIVGVSYEQAMQFCSWREQLVNVSQRKKVHITLPPMEVYNTINESTDSTKKSKAGKDGCLRYHFNYAHASCSSVGKHDELKGEGYRLLRTDVYSPTKLKIYCLQGNAAEMTATKGIAVGGSFRHFAKASFANEVQIYQHEEDWLGFRCYVSLY